MVNEKRWDVFLSYSSPDQAEVERLAMRLEDEAHLRVFLDKWRLVPGEGFMPGLQDEIRASRCCAVIVGTSAIRPWQNAEMQLALRRMAGSEGEFRVIPVLLPGAQDPGSDEWPDFLALQTCVDFRTADGLGDSEAFNQLVCGIRGVPPGRPKARPEWMSTVTAPGLEHPTGIAADSDAVFAADHASGRVQRFEHGRVTASAGDFAKPHHIAFVGDELVVADTHNHRLAYLDSGLNVRKVRRKIGRYELHRPHGLSSNYPNELYVADSDNHRVLLVQGDAVVTAAGRAGCRSGIDAGEFSIPCGVAASMDCVYVADTYNHRIQVLTRDLRYLSTFGSAGNGVGQFAYPVGVASWHDWIVVADEYNKRLQL